MSFLKHALLNLKRVAPRCIERCRASEVQIVDGGFAVQISRIPGNRDVVVTVTAVSGVGSAGATVVVAEDRWWDASFFIVSVPPLNRMPAAQASCASNVGMPRQIQNVECR